jgi:hypothetical protein
MGDLNGGAVFVGKRGRLEIVRNGFRFDPPALQQEVELPPREEVVKWDRAQWQAKYHMQDWLDAIRTRRPPLAPPEIGHRSITIAHLANLARELNRPLRWNPTTETIEGDPDAAALLVRPRRPGFELP